MKKTLIITILSITALILSMLLTGCSDFAFNPTGQWHFSEDLLYIDDELAQKITPEDDVRMNNVTLVFEKSGTGYIDSSTKNKVHFTYEYNGNEITIKMPNNNADNKNTGNENDVLIKYTVSDDQKTISRVDTQNITDENGKKITYREEFIYKK